MKLNEHRRSMSFSDLGKRSLRFQNQNLFFLESTGSFETKFLMKAYRTMGMKKYTNEFWSHDQDGCHAHIWLKKTLKSFSPELFNGPPWNLVCRITCKYPGKYYQECSNDVLGLTLTFFYDKVRYGKKLMHSISLKVLKILA